MFHCWELKHNGRIDKTYSRDSLAQIISKDIEHGKKIKVMHMNTLHDRFPDVDLEKMHKKIIAIHCNQATNFV